MPATADVAERLVKMRMGQRPVGDTAAPHGRMERIAITSIAVKLVNQRATGADLHNNAAAVGVFGIESHGQDIFEQLRAPTAVWRLPIPVSGMEADLFNRNANGAAFTPVLDPICCRSADHGFVHDRGLGRFRGHTKDRRKSNTSNPR